MDYTALIHGVTELAAGASRQRLLERRLDEARQLAREGLPLEAVAAYRAVLKTFRTHAGGWHELALLHFKLGDIGAATASLVESITLEPWRPHAHYDFGRVQASSAAPDVAPEYLLALGIRGQARHTLATAVAECARQCRLTPSLENRLRLSHLQIASQDLSNAVETLRAAVVEGFDVAAVSSSLADGYELLGGLRDSQVWRGHARYLSEEYPEAVDQYSKVIAKSPGEALVYARLGTAHAALHQYPEALGACRLGISHYPDDQTLVCLLAEVLQADGQLEASRRVATDASLRFPKNIRLRQHAVLSLPVVYQTADEVREKREAFANGLGALTQHVLVDRAAISLDRGHGPGTNFLLPYQGGDDKTLQVRFGALQHHIACERDPQWSRHVPMPPLEAGQKLRVGYVSSHLYRHTVAKLFLGWLTERSTARTEVFVYHLGRRLDPMTQQYQRAADQFFQLQGPPTMMCRQIAQDRLHVLVYLDVGMDDLTTQLAALRLAPVQCAAWGHPVTTGLSTIDYFISSELMEPSGADEHYSETLVRLPGIGVNVPAPYLEPPIRTRAEFGLSADDCVYLSPQSLFKYLPQHDELFCRIAARVPNVKFVFLESASRNITAMLKRRLSDAFGRCGLDRDRCLVFLPGLNHRDYLDLNRAADIFLDQPGWSGGMTALEAIGCGLPVVTWPGQFMRGRHSSAFLRAMGLGQLVASDLDHFVDIAARLGAEPAWRQQLRSTISGRSHQVFNDGSCVRALEQFYVDAVARFESR